MKLRRLHEATLDPARELHAPEPDEVVAPGPELVQVGAEIEPTVASVAGADRPGLVALAPPGVRSHQVDGLTAPAVGEVARVGLQRAEWACLPRLLLRRPPRRSGGAVR